MKKLVLLAAAFAASGCATVIRGTKETAEFESDPQGATVTAESTSEDRLGPFTCTTPCELELKRKRTWIVDFEKEGYKPVTGRLEPVVTGGGVASGAGNVLAGGLIGIGVDAGTGANLDLRPNPLRATLAPEDSDEPSRVNSREEPNGDVDGDDLQDEPLEDASEEQPVVEEQAAAETEDSELP